MKYIKYMYLYLALIGDEPKQWTEMDRLVDSQFRLGIHILLTIYSTTHATDLH